MDEESLNDENKKEIDQGLVNGIQLTLEKIEEEISRVKLELAKSGLVSGGGINLHGRLKDLKTEEDEEGKTIEGVFDGQQMIGPDGKRYSIPANYISKSKLVEGDILKLRILGDGTFVYKQIGPVDRERKVGKLVKDDEENFGVMIGNRIFRVILAAVTYFHGAEGDEVVILVPKDIDSKWAAIENIIKASSSF
ncbi:MAG: hypothetical protein COX77_00845 [Candidatus Komeilibacteria bacterium CG_4_10_14_0_2_um_filter_37_10]|uniref:50S ribosomal protein L7/L12 n=1 Tax=Candidatus Komeilibacteria bacterium CG_4_10_14_0_2_um_filter_37_10 TaxID=1974470 RepID=A0A2M7VG66_9BACT|nr:MAG: hypothetical protein COX77_00845 [Candidatus Komeilibacteria bacterium CG_4_10_14_0_2_um_filter_37_10]PJA92608.1 MAG: hypothetical protein CO133_02250 [Candidatus Komeilibacteria bacterium CG_4_9_14_3_um_filter_37_5]